MIRYPVNLKLFCKISFLILNVGMVIHFLLSSIFHFINLFLSPQHSLHVLRGCELVLMFDFNSRILNCTARL